MSTTPFFRILFVLISLYFLLSCSEALKILQQSNIRQPAVSISSARLTGLSFDKADLQVDIDINNPNSLAIDLSAFDYEVLINGKSFLSGTENQGLNIAANKSSTIQLPVSLRFNDILSTFRELKSSDSIRYQIKSGLSFDLPMSGSIRVPVSKNGTFPNLKMPSVQLASVRLNDLSFSAASVDVQIKVDNPNSWSLDLLKMDYRLTVNDMDWIEGASSAGQAIAGKKSGYVRIPVKLNFLQMGQSVYNLLTGNGDLSYTLEGQADLKSSLELLGEFKLPFRKNGQTTLIK